MKVGDKVHVEVVGRISDEGIFSAWSLVHFFNIIVVNYIVIVFLCICVLLGLCPLSAISSLAVCSVFHQIQIQKCPVMTGSGWTQRE